jgi:multiple sugar transport system substrate-binding protein
VRALSAGSKNEEAAYLFMQWVTSPPMSLVRTMLPYTLRDPYRMSTYKSDQYRALWPAAKDYLSNLCEAANGGVVDMIMPGWQDYALTIDRMCTAVWGGQDPEAALKSANDEWNAVSKRLGVEAQKAAYEQFLKIPGSYADHTIDKLGLSVHVS